MNAPALINAKRLQEVETQLFKVWLQSREMITHYEAAQDVEMLAKWQSFYDHINSAYEVFFK